MINPRTVPYTPQRLAVIKQEFTRPLPKISQTPFPFTAINSELLKETPQAALEIGCAPVAGNVILVTNSSQATKLSSVIGNEPLSSEETKKRLISYLPYIIGGVIVTLAIYFYLQSRRAKEKEETNSARL